MARLSEMIPGFAQALKVPERSVRNVASVLRLNKLLTSGPRGPGAPHMGPSDATNLLLALMYDDDHEAAASTVTRLRAARLDHCEGVVGFDYGGGKLDRLPGHEFVGAGGTPHTLGDAVDLILHELSCYGALGDDAGSAQPADWLEVVNFSFAVSRPGYSAQLWLDTIAVHWTLNYSWHDPETAARHATVGSHMSSTRSVDDAGISAVATVLRGFDLDGSDQAGCDPPYMPRLLAEEGA